MPKWHVTFSRTCIVPQKNNSACPEAHGLLAPKPDHPKNMVLVLMGPLVAPNRVLTGSPGRESRAGAAGGVGLAPNMASTCSLFQVQIPVEARAQNEGPGPGPGPNFGPWAQIWPWAMSIFPGANSRGGSRSKRRARPRPGPGPNFGPWAQIWPWVMSIFPGANSQKGSR